MVVEKSQVILHPNGFKTECFVKKIFIKNKKIYKNPICTQKVHLAQTFRQKCRVFQARRVFKNLFIVYFSFLA
jgi:hypothetical protein